MEKLNKLLSSKRYINKTNKDYFLELIKKEKELFKIKNTDNNEIVFLSNYLIKDENIEVLDRYSYYSKYYLSKHLIGIILSLCIILILGYSGKFIRVVEFRNSFDYNDEIYLEVQSHLIRRGLGYVLDTTINELSNKLRNKYPEYAWIGLTRDSGRLIIDIDYQDVPKVEHEDLTIKGDLVASCDAIIEEIIVERGVVIVINNQSVKKGELLVSGNLNILNDPTNKSNLVRSKGYIIGKTLALEEKVILKKQEEVGVTGNIKTQKVLSVLGFQIGKNQVSFDNYYTNSIEIFNFLNIITIREITYYEQDIIKGIYDEEAAIRYAESLIKKEFAANQVSNNEKIQNIELFDIRETSDSYIVRFITTKLQNIAEFSQY